MKLNSHLFNKGQQSLTVVLPLKRQFTLMGKLITAQEDGELEAVCVQVAEVIHTCGGDCVLEEIFSFSCNIIWLFR